MKQDPSRKPVSVEDLIRVKRGEHPDRAFWSDWQGAMQVRLSSVKQQKRAWWRDALPRLWISIAKWQAPVGASALLLLGFVAVQEYHRALPPLAGSLASETSTHVLVQAPAVMTATPVRSSLLEKLGPSSMDSKPRQPGELTGSIAMAGYVSSFTAGPSARLADAALEGLGASFPSKLSPSIEQPASTEHVSRQSGRGSVLGFSYGDVVADAGASSRAPGHGDVSLDEERLADGLARRSAGHGDRVSLRF